MSLRIKRDYGYLKENIFNEKVENISVRMKLPGNKNYEWHRIFRNFERDEKGNLKKSFRNNNEYRGRKTS